MARLRVAPRFGRALVVAGLALTGACTDLSVENTNAPDRSRALADPSDVENLIAGTFRNYYFGTHNLGNNEGSIAFLMSAAADEHTSSAANFAMIDFYQEPRRAINNAASYNNINYFTYTYRRMYRVISAASDGLRAIDNPQKPIRIIVDGEDQTQRARAFARLNMGMAYGVLAATYDQGFIVDEKTEDLGAVELSPYTDVHAAAQKYLDDAIAIATANDFEIPVGWWPTDRPYTNEDVVRLAHSYKARFRAWVARNPAERAAVNWNQVIADANAGIQENFTLVIDDVNYSDDLAYYTTAPGWARWDLRFAGMAETDGTDYQTWMATPVAQRQPFTFASTDRRWPSTPTGTNGKHVRYVADCCARPERGTYNWSNYRDYRWSAYWSASDIPLPEMTVDEMRMLRAEGLIRTNQLAAAAQLINVTRVGVGQLPPVTTAGVPNTPDCVPQLPNGACGDLFEAMKWEKRNQVYETTLGDWFFDNRGWDDLPVGTARHFPVPAPELEVLGLPVYTYGGVGGNCAVGSTTCNLPSGSANMLASDLLTLGSAPRAQGRSFGVR